MMLHNSLEVIMGELERGCNGLKKCFESHSRDNYELFRDLMSDVDRIKSVVRSDVLGLEGIRINLEEVDKKFKPSGQRYYLGLYKNHLNSLIIELREIIDGIHESYTNHKTEKDFIYHNIIDPVLYKIIGIKTLLTCNKTGLGRIVIKIDELIENIFHSKTINYT